MGFFSPSKSGKASAEPTPVGKPLHLLQYDERTKKFELGSEALDALRVFDIIYVLTPMAVPGIASTLLLNIIIAIGFELTLDPVRRILVGGISLTCPPIQISNRTIDIKR